MSRESIELAKQFIAIRSTPENTKALNEILDLAVSHLSDFTVERFERDGAKSALIYNTSERPEQFRVILNGHLDIIPGKDAQFEPYIKDKRLYGVGSMDMKANTASLIEAFKHVAQQVSYPLGIQLVTDEEIGGFNGTKYQVEEGVRTDFALIGESTDFDIENQAKGVLWMKIITRGESAHGAYPWKGTNAVWKLYEFLTNLKKKFPPPTEEVWQTTVNLSNIDVANETFNKIPDRAEAWLDVRFTPEQEDTIVDTVTSLLPQGSDYEVVAHEPAFSTDEKHPDVQALKHAIEKNAQTDIAVRSANGSSDVRHFARVDCPGVEFGPIGGGMGTDEEWVDMDSLDTYEKTLQDFLLGLDR